MRCRVTLCTALALLADFSYAANACKKDACYNAIAVQGRSSPNLARRKADCSSILRTVVNTDITKTVTAYSTAPTVTTTTTVRTTVEVTSTTTTTTSTSFEPSDFKKRAVETAIAELDARDKIVIQGQKPAYASACASNSDYAVACLCYGIQAPVQSTLTRTVTATVTTQATATSTTISTSTSTTFTTTSVPAPTGPCAGYTTAFKLQAADIEDQSVNGKYAQLQQAFGSGYRISFDANPPSAQVFRLQPDCSLLAVDRGVVGMTGGNANLHYVYMFASTAAAAALINVNWELALCVVNTDQTLTCTSQGQSIFQITEGETLLRIGDQSYEQDVTLNVIPVV